MLSLCAALALVGAASFLLVRRQRGGKAAVPTGTEIETHEYEEVNVAAPSSPTYSSTTPPVYAETDMDGIGAGAADPEYVLSSKLHEENHAGGLEKNASPERQTDGTVGCSRGQQRLRNSDHASSRHCCSPVGC